MIFFILSITSLLSIYLINYNDYQLISVGNNDIGYQLDYIIWGISIVLVIRGIFYYINYRFSKYLVGKYKILYSFFLITLKIICLIYFGVSGSLCYKVLYNYFVDPTYEIYLTNGIQLIKKFTKEEKIYWIKYYLEMLNANSSFKGLAIVLNPSDYKFLLEMNTIKEIYNNLIIIFDNKSKLLEMSLKEAANNSYWDTFYNNIFSWNMLYITFGVCAILGLAYYLSPSSLWIFKKAINPDLVEGIKKKTINNTNNIDILEKKINKIIKLNNTHSTLSKDIIRKISNNEDIISKLYKSEIEAKKQILNILELSTNSISKNEVDIDILRKQSEILAQTILDNKILLKKVNCNTVKALMPDTEYFRKVIELLANVDVMIELTDLADIKDKDDRLQNKTFFRYLHDILKKNNKFWGSGNRLGNE